MDDTRTAGIYEADKAIAAAAEHCSKEERQGILSKEPTGLSFVFDKQGNIGKVLELGRQNPMGAYCKDDRFSQAVK